MQEFFCLVEFLSYKNQNHEPRKHPDQPHQQQPYDRYQNKQQPDYQQNHEQVTAKNRSNRQTEQHSTVGEECQQAKHDQNQKGTEKELRAHPENVKKHSHEVEK